MSEFTGNDVLSAIAAASKNLSARKDEINRLNVFPVPDGDTGTNMSLTLESVVKNLEKQLKSKDSNVVAEAQEIISAIDSAKSDVKEDIALYREADPAEAIKLINLFLKTWPKDDSAKEYKDAIGDLKKAAAEKAKAAKEKAKEK